MNFIVYRKIDGNILLNVEAPDDYKELYEDEFNSTMIFDKENNLEYTKYYILNEVLTLKPSQLTAINKTTLNADGIDTIEITNAPTGIFTATNSETITGEISGSDTFATTIAGTYTITITSFPYLDFTATIEAI